MEILRVRGKLDGPARQRQLALFALLEGGERSAQLAEDGALAIPYGHINSAA